MKCFFLGTGAAEGLPALFCDCEICEEARRRGGPDKRTRSTVLIDGIIKVDLPPDTLAHVHNYPQLRMNALRHLLFTHSHDDHFAVRELQYLSPTFAPCRKEPLCVWGACDLLERMRPEMAGFFEAAPLRFCPLEPFETVPIEHLLVTPIVAHHKADELCFNYLLSNPVEGRTLLYASDTGWWDPPTWEFLEGCPIDAVILECGKGAVASGYDGHLHADECIRVKERLMAAGSLKAEAPFYLTHISHTGRLLHKELKERVASCGIQVAYDGLEISF